MSSDLDKTRTIISTHSEHPRGAVKPCLVIIAGSEMGRQLDLGEESVEIGRSENATITVNSDLVSRRHASIQRLMGHYVVMDLGSTNGTFVNDKRVKSHPLADGDRVRIGRTIIKYMETHVEVEYHQQLMNMVTVDALTGARNKRAFDELFTKEIQRHAGAGEPLSLLIFDIDHFKKINDTFGHPAGDAVLKKVVEVAVGVLRAEDALCRVGGEEFAVLLPKTDRPGAADVGERLRAAIEAARFQHEGGEIPVTVSVGAAELGVGVDEAQALYRRADDGLYAAKRGGRNRVC